jgi:hypothetical protein
VVRASVTLCLQIIILIPNVMEIVKENIRNLYENFETGTPLKENLRIQSVPQT